MYKPLYIRVHPERTSQVRGEGEGISPKGTKYSNIYSNNDVIGGTKGGGGQKVRILRGRPLWMPPKEKNVTGDCSN